MSFFVVPDAVTDELPAASVGHLLIFTALRRIAICT